MECICFEMESNEAMTMHIFKVQDERKTLVRFPN